MRASFSQWLSDTWSETRRHLVVTRRNPELLVFATLQPIMFVLLFVYVFGGAISVPGFANYKQYLVPGVFAQTVVFGSAFTSIGVADEKQKGLINRLRSLPMAQSAVLFGRTASDLLRNLFTFVVMILVALAVGFRFKGSLGETLLGIALFLAFSYSLSWIHALIGLSVKSVEAANSGGFLWMFPLTFLSSAFVDTSTMPRWLEAVANANPFTTLTNAGRALFNGNSPGSDLWVSLLWATGICVVFATVSMKKYLKRD